MALHVGTGSDPEENVLSEINVTPLVDVMLVLLVIFMITAPMMHRGIEVALPRAEAENLPMRVDDPLVLSINRDGVVYLGSTPIHSSQLVERLTPILAERKDESVFLKGDRDVAYGVVIDVLDTLRKTVTGAPDMDTRVRAARALGILRAREAVPELIEAAFSNQVDLIAEVLRAFQKIQDASVGPRIIFLLKYPQQSIQQRAAITLGLLRTHEAIPELRNLLENSGDKNVRMAALEALAFMPVAETAAVFQAYLNDKEKQMRASAALALGRLKEANYSGILEQSRQKEKDAGVRLALAFALVAHGRMELLDELVSSLGSRVRVGEARPYLMELARQEAVRNALYPKLYSPDPDIRKNLCAVLAASGNGTSISYLEVLLRDSDAEVVQEASRAIRILRSRGM